MRGSDGVPFLTEVDGLEERDVYFFTYTPFGVADTGKDDFQGEGKRGQLLSEIGEAYPANVAMDEDQWSRRDIFSSISIRGWIVNHYVF